MEAQGPVVKYAEKLEIARMIAAAGELGEPDSYDGKRDDLRISDGLQLEVRTDPTGRSAPVSMENISEGGFAFWSKVKMAQRDGLFVRQFSEDNSRPWLPAEVTHCTVGIRGFLIGAAFVIKKPAQQNQ